ncbi:MAG: hypothetical protein RLZZ46_229 [Bacteroidota bacterium]|jgi:predicted aminopeptidase
MKYYAGFIVQLFLLLSSLVFLLLRSELEYLLVQGRGQIQMSFSARDIAEALRDSAISLKQKEGLMLSMQVLKFASEKGLHTGDAYTMYCDEKNEKQMWMLSAVPSCSFESFQWSFPLFGSFSYKGFFSLNMALKEKKKLSEQGFDTELGKAAGWSTLGWFPDPVTASMLKRKPYDLAELLLHELVHKTVYLKDSVEWNENLAVLCARNLCAEFLRQAGQEQWLHEYAVSLQAEDSLLAFAEHGKRWLSQKYAQKDFNKADKQSLLKILVQDFLSRSWSSEFPKYKIAASMLYNGNAWFQSHHRYGGGSKELSEMLMKKHRGNVMAMLKELKK